jgi:hypothetical protein
LRKHSWGTKFGCSSGFFILNTLFFLNKKQVLIMWGILERKGITIFHLKNKPNRTYTRQDVQRSIHIHIFVKYAVAASKVVQETLAWGEGASKTMHVF